MWNTTLARRFQARLQECGRRRGAGAQGSRARPHRANHARRRSGAPWRPVTARPGSSPRRTFDRTCGYARRRPGSISEARARFPTWRPPLHDSAARPAGLQGAAVHSGHGEDIRKGQTAGLEGPFHGTEHRHRGPWTQLVRPAVPRGVVDDHGRPGHTGHACPKNALHRFRTADQVREFVEVVVGVTVEILEVAEQRR